MATRTAPEAPARKAFVTALRRQRLSRGLTQAALAKKLGLKTQSTVSFWESGESIPTPTMIPKLARILGVTAMELTMLIEPDDAPAAAAGK